VSLTEAYLKMIFIVARTFDQSTLGWFGRTITSAGNVYVSSRSKAVSERAARVRRTSASGGAGRVEPRPATRFRGEQVDQRHGCVNA
jgi:hypothetical protein